MPVAFLLLPLAGAGCTGNGSGKNNPEPQTGINQLEIPLPDIPDSLTDLEDRTAFITSHFWDELDFIIDSRSRDTAFMEQNFSNFISLLPYIPENKAQESVDRLLEKAAADDEAFRLLSHIADRYLDDPNSPMRSERLYTLFLRHIAESRTPAEEMRMRARHRLSQAMKNRAGTKAADFRMITRDGVETTLLKAVSGDTTLVMFYDPDCTQCKEFTHHLDESPISSRFRILSIDVASDRKLWDSTKRSMPSRWEVAFALDPVDDDEIYYLPALPTLYLLSPSGEVIVKDMTF